jgi:glucokinase
VVDDARVGVDLGGTSAKVGLVRDGRLLRRAQVPNPHEFEACVRAIAGAAREVCDGAAPAFVGIGLPGVTDAAQRVILDAPNLSFLEGRDLAAAVERELGARVRLENDANVAALGEARHGAGAQHPDFLLATLGTGVGGGIVLGGELWRGPGGMAGEFGHLLTGHERRCGCGATGCLEASASALASRARGAAPEPRAAEVFQLAGAALGEALSAVALLLDLRVFLFGGGGAPVLDLLEPHALAVLDRRAFGRHAADFRLLRAGLGNDAGILGAAML